MAPDSQDWVRYDDLNGFLDSLRQEDDLLEIKEEVSPRFEMGALLRALGEREGPAALFTNVAGFPGKVIAGNVMGHRRRLSKTLGVSVGDLTEAYLERKNHRVAPVTMADAPLKQVTVRAQEIDLHRILPALTHHEKDASPYLTCAVTLARDPETGCQSMGMHRIQIQSSQRLGICLATPPLSRFLQKAWEMNRPLEVAIIMGPDPAVLIASVTRCPGGEDKMEIAGGFRARPVEMVPCETVDLRVPARAQYLIEGTIQPGHLAHEGLFGESSGVYVEAQSPVIGVTSISHRREPIYQALQTWSSEDDALLNLCFGSDLLEEVRKEYPFVRDLHMVTGTLCAHAVASVGLCPRPSRRSAIVALLTRNPFVKFAIVVDDDIDIRNPREVEWAVATRFQADRDLIVISGVQGSVIDPSAASDGSSCKIGIDATYTREREAVFQKIQIPVESRRRAMGIVERLIGYTGKAVPSS